MVFKETIALLCATLGLLFFVSCDVFIQEKTKANNELVVGLNSGFPPYEVLNAQGQFEGFDIDVANLIANKMGKKLVIKDMAFDGLVLALNQNKIDLILSGMSISPQKMHELTMVHYQGNLETTIGLYFWKQVPTGVTKLEDVKKLENNTVCTQAGMTMIEDFLSSTGCVKPKTLENIADLVLDIKYGKSIAVALDVMIGDALKKANPALVMLEIPLPEKYHTLGYGIGIKKNNKALEVSIETIIQECKANGTLAKLEKKWFAGGSHA